MGQFSWEIKAEIEILEEEISRKEDIQDAAWAAYYACPVTKIGVRRSKLLWYENEEANLDYMIQKLDKMKYKLKCYEKNEALAYGPPVDSGEYYKEDFYYADAKCSCDHCLAEMAESWNMVRARSTVVNIVC
jgi:hypothetical protein